jgi:Transposase and inactivated derivatives
MEIRADHQKGLSYSELGRKYNIDRRTAKKYAESESRPEYVLTDSKPSKLDSYKPQITLWLEEAPYSAMRIWEKVKEQGFEGGYTTVKHFVRGKKEQLNEQATVRFETCPDYRPRWIGRSSRTSVCESVERKRSCIAS